MVAICTCSNDYDFTLWTALVVYSAASAEKSPHALRRRERLAIRPIRLTSVLDRERQYATEMLLCPSAGGVYSRLAAFAFRSLNVKMDGGKRTAHGANLGNELALPPGTSNYCQPITAHITYRCHGS